MTDEPWLTRAEVARKLRVSVKTIQRRYRPTMVVGNQNRYLMSDIRAQAAAHRGDLPANVTALPQRPKEKAA